MAIEMRLGLLLVTLLGCWSCVDSESHSVSQFNRHLRGRRRNKKAGLHLLKHRERDAARGNFPTQETLDFDSLKGTEGTVSFYMYDIEEFEPRFFDRFSGCPRKGADYMFVDSLRKHPKRTWWWPDADVIVVPCLFETYRRCSSHNTAERPPSFLQVADMPENYEAIPWRKAFDDQTQRCLAKVAESDAFKMTGGKRHFFLAADWSMQFGRTLQQQLFKNMTIGRIEGIDVQEAQTSNRHFDLEAGCSVVVPFASDVAYKKDWNQRASFEEWVNRPNLVSFRFEDRQYTLFCNQTRCKGAVDATPLRKQALALRRVVGDRALIHLGRTSVSRYAAELHESKFCLVVRGDTPSSHAFYDALAAGCIPVLVSDRWGSLAAPFAHGHAGVMQGGMDFSSFTVRVPEYTWMGHVEKVADRLQAIEEDEARSKTLYHHLLKARASLLWSIPHAAVSESVLAAAWKCAHLD